MKADIYLKRYLSDKERFADLFNAVLFDGEEILKADAMSILSGESALVLKDKDGKEVGVQRYRDILMKAENGIRLMLLAVENQDEVHYAMPVRGMLYDALSYTEQVQIKTKENRKNKVLKGNAEFLSGLKKSERLIPVITLVLYYGDTWDGCKDIHGLTGLDNKSYEGLKKYIPNYHINLIQAKDMVENTRLKTDLRLFFGILQYKEDRDGMRQYLYRHEKYFRNIDLDTYGAMNAVLGVLGRIEVEDAECGGVDMCKAFEDMYLDGKSEGKAEGISLSILAILHNLGDLPEDIAEQVQAEKNVELLNTWLKKAIRVENLDEFIEYIK